MAEILNAAETEGFSPFEANEADPYEMPDVERLEQARAAQEEQAQKRAEKPSAERTAELFEKMRADRKALLAILAACSKPCSEQAVERTVAETTRGKRSVYAPATLCALLLEAGALAKVDEQGEPYRAEDLEPVRTVVDGVEYLEPPTPPALHWLSTDAGRAAVEADRPLARLEELFDTKAELLPVFKRVLTLCSADEGAKTPSVNAAVDDDPLVQEPRYYASYFTEQLERCDCLAWEDHAWHTTPMGWEALEMLEGVVDDAEER